MDSLLPGRCKPAWIEVALSVSTARDFDFSRSSDSTATGVSDCSQPPPSATLESVGRFYSRPELLEQRRRWKQEGRTVVFTNGCYDLLHPGHTRLLEQARSLGDLLILALNSDASVRRAKGATRPLIPEAERAELALSLEAVDAVTLFDEDTPRQLVAEVLPDILLKGADWSHFIAGKEEVEAAGGRVLTVPLEPGYSTTNIVELVLTHQP
jgi:rfaE bifunctional protein nucleotidyltransferase chain/domain